MDGNKTILIVVGVIALVVVGGLMVSNNANKESENASMEDMEVTVNTDNQKEDMMMEESKEEAMEEVAMEPTIVDIAAGSADFTTLVTAVTEAGLVETLSGPGPFTVFAPTNEAFAKIPAETLTAILADKEQLTDILTYHVVAGKVMAEDVVGLDSATTVQGQDVKIAVLDDGTVTVNDAKVISVDIEGSNGVIHVIDTVLLPE